MKKLGLILILLFAAEKAHATLEWKSTVLVVEAERGQNVARVIFEFKNAGACAVRIATVKSTCPCLTPRIEKEVFDPGETGQVHAEISIPEAAASITRHLFVEIDDPARTRQRLTLIVNVFQPLHFSQCFIFWRMTEKTTEKLVTIAVADPPETVLRDLETTHALFHVRLESGDRAGAYHLWIKPVELRAGLQADIRINVIVGGEEQVYAVYAAVK